MECKIRHDAMSLRKLTSIKVIERIFTQTFIVSETLKFEMFNLENLGRGHGVQNAQRCHSAVYTNLYNNNSTNFLG